MHQSEQLTAITNLEAFRAQRLAEQSTREVQFQQFPITQHEAVAIKTKGFTVQAVVTEPLDTDVHTEHSAIVIKHGFMASRPAYNDYAKQLAAAGHRVVHYGMPRSTHPALQYRRDVLGDTLSLHSRALGAVSRHLRETYPDSPEKHWYIGHSMGGLALSKFLEHSPDSAERAILLGSTGLARHTFANMVGRALYAIPSEISPYIRDMSRSKRRELGLHSAYHVARNPLLLLREGYQAATGNALENITAARSAGVKIGAISMTEDTFFPLRELDQTVTDMFDDHAFVWGNHLKPQEFPKFAANDALAMFSRLGSTAHIGSATA